MGENPALTDAEIVKICGEKDPATNDFFFQQTMYRVKDPRRSLEFYSKVLGMTLLMKKDFPEAKFSLYFMGYEPKSEIPSDDQKRTEYALTRRATLELTHNWGTENDPDFSYKIGNADGMGHGHIGIWVSDVYAACKRFEQLGVQFQKKPDDGRMKGLAFIKDPDGYWIEIFTTSAC